MIAGLDWTPIGPGARLRVGDEVLLEVVSDTTPCRHNARWFWEGDYPCISQHKYPGWCRVSARVLEKGMVHQGDVVSVENPIYGKSSPRQSGGVAIPNGGMRGRRRATNV
jgi:MOSC domain-containing protein YiiM